MSNFATPAVRVKNDHPPAPSLRDAGGLERGHEKAAAGVAPVSRWRPIATAPVDGTLVIIFESADLVSIGKHSKIAGRWIRLSSFFGQASCRPTHWMPLPPPPEKREARAW